MYYRRKLLLAILESAGKPVNRLRLQKLLLLVCAGQNAPSYNFIPHKFGCYSFQVDADKRTLEKYKLITSSEEWALRKNGDYIGMLRHADADCIQRTIATTQRMKDKDLLRHVYKKYPYYATNSDIRETLLTTQELLAVESARPKAKRARLFTIGYESRSLEQYLNLLSNNKVRVLCDVRRNAMSMKFGFNKRQLESALESVGIEYLHLPELGIASIKRSKLETTDEYQGLFDDYERTTLADNSDALKRITHLVFSKRRVALTCFELCHEDCHRHRIVNTLVEEKSFGYKVAHL